MAAMDMSATKIAGEWSALKEIAAIPPITSGTPIWYRRSKCLSELHEIITIDNSPKMCGIITTSPTVILEYIFESALIPCGIQKVNV
jgi:hypothetical protein